MKVKHQEITRIVYITSLMARLISSVPKLP